MTGKYIYFFAIPGGEPVSRESGGPSSILGCILSRDFKFHTGTYTNARGAVFGRFLRGEGVGVGLGFGDGVVNDGDDDELMTARRRG